MEEEAEPGGEPAEETPPMVEAEACASLGGEPRAIDVRALRGRGLLTKLLGLVVSEVVDAPPAA